VTGTDDSAAVYLRLENGDILERRKRSRRRGTTISVHHLFRHIPARLKFLKSQGTENGHIASLLTQYALAYPEVRFSLISEGRQAIKTTGSGNMKDAIAELYGIDIAGQMIEIFNSDQNCTISGYVSPPPLSRSNRSYLSFFVNRRWVHSSLLSRAAEDSYQGLLMTGKHPIVIVNISLPPQEIDVNVHPSKIEVKFRNGNIVYGALSRAIKEVISKTAPPEIRNSVVFSPPPPRLWEERSEVALTATTPPSPEKTAMPAPRPQLPQVPILRVVGQMAASYILAEGPEGLYLIDQHAAHERILFEKVQEQRSRQNLELQGLLQPLPLDLNPGQAEVINTQSALLEQFGIALEPFGNSTCLIRAVPAMMANGDVAGAVIEVLDGLSSEETADAREKKTAQLLACHGAVKAGQVLSVDEMREMIKQLEETSQPRTCPHGRPTMIHLSSRQLEKEFGRVR
jgi:DNA mismatch repair protein MutL